MTDLLVSYTSSSGWYAYTALGKGDGTFFPPQGGQLSTSGFGGVNDYEKLVGDVNGDGLTDILVVYTGTSGLYAYTAIGKGDGTFFPPQGGQLSASSFGSIDYYSKLVGDINGDGVTDILVAYTRTDGWYAYTSLGKGDGTFLTPQGGQLSTSSFGSADLYSKLIGDFNGDGVADLMAVSTSSGGWYSYIALGKGDGLFLTPQGGQLSTSSFGTNIAYSKHVGDFNHDGIDDLVVAYTGTDGFYAYSAFDAQVSQNLVNRVELAQAAVDITFLPLSAGSFYTKGTTSLYPRVDIQGPLRVVSSVTGSNGVGGFRQTNYSYGNAVAELGTGRGFLGFEWVQSEDVSTGQVSRTWYRQDWPFTGVVSKVERGTSTANRSNLGITTYTYDCTDFDSTAGCLSAAGKRYFPFVTRVEEKNWDLNGVALPITRTDTLYDCGNASTACFGNALDLTVSTLNPDGSSSGYSKRTQSQFYNDTDNWILGRLLRSSVTHSAP